MNYVFFWEGVRTRLSRAAPRHSSWLIHGERTTRRSMHHFVSLVCCLAKIHWQFNLISNGWWILFFSLEQGPVGAPRHRKWHTLSSLIFNGPLFLVSSFLVVRRTWIELLSGARLLYTHKSTFVYSGGRGTFEHRFSIFLSFLSLLFIFLFHSFFLSLSLHQTTRCTRISRISLTVYFTYSSLRAT